MEDYPVSVGEVGFSLKSEARANIYGRLVGEGLLHKTPAIVAATYCCALN